MDGWTAALIIIPLGVVLLIYIFTDGERRIKKIESRLIKAEDSQYTKKSTPNNPINGTQTVTSVKHATAKKGTTTGVVGTILTALLWIDYFLFGGVTRIQASMLNEYTLTATAAIVSIFGIFFRDASCMLLAAVALVGAFLADVSTFLGLIPAVLLMISHVQMKKQYVLETTEKEE